MKTITINDEELQLLRYWLNEAENQVDEFENASRQAGETTSEIYWRIQKNILSGLVCRIQGGG